MVDNMGNWTEEKDYTIYPEEKWCMYDHLANLIRKDKYEIKTTMKNLITIILLSAENAVDDGIDILLDYPQDIIRWMREQGGYSEFDYEA